MPPKAKRGAPKSNRLPIVCMSMTRPQHTLETTWHAVFRTPDHPQFFNYITLFKNPDPARTLRKLLMEFPKDTLKPGDIEKCSTVVRVSMAISRWPLMLIGLKHAPGWSRVTVVKRVMYNRFETRKAVPLTKYQIFARGLLDACAQVMGPVDYAIDVPTARTALLVQALKGFGFEQVDDSEVYSLQVVYSQRAPYSGVETPPLETSTPDDEQTGGIRELAELEDADS